MTANENNEASKPKWLLVARIGLIVAFLVLSTGVVAAQDGSSQEELQNQMQDIGDFLTIVIVAVAAPNAAYGLFEYMTAGTDAEATQNGKNRIRNSFIAAGGATVIQIAVRVLAGMVGSGGG